MNRFKYFIISGTLLTVVTLSLRTIAVAFNVYLSNKIGAIAMGLFGLISTVYNFGITIATSGINLATTRLVSEELGKNDKKDISLNSVLKKSISYAIFFGVISSLMIFFSAEYVGAKMLGDSRTVIPIKISALTLPFIAVSSALSGYFTAIRKVYKNAIVQTLGQFTRIYLCTAFLAIFNSEKVENVCLAIVFGGALSEISAFLLQFILYIFDRHNNENTSCETHERGKEIKKKLLSITLPVAFSSYVRSGLVTLEHLLIPWGLKKSGSTQEKSLAAYGIVQSMVFPLILFPSAISSSFAGLLIPEMAQANAESNTGRIKAIAQRVFKSIFIFSIGTSGLIICFSYELGNTFYPNTSAPAYILMLAPLIPVMYMDTSVDSMLKGLGKQTITMIINVIDATLSVILVFLLLPRFGILGFIITVYFTEIVNATLSLTYLLKVCEIKIKVLSWIGKPLLCILAATWLSRKLLGTLGLVATYRYETLLHILLGAVTYVAFLFMTKALKFNEIKSSLKNLM